MGTDIRLFVEKKVNGQWESIKGKFNNDDEIEDAYDGDEIFFERAYEVYAMLAGVRNGEGVDGPGTGAYYSPISLPKGLPADASIYIAKQYKKQNTDPYSAHDCSWLLLKEILEYDWDRQERISAYVSKEHAKAFYETGTIPGSIDRKNKSNRILKLGYEKIEWGSNYAEIVGNFYSRIMPRLGEYGEPDEVRIVFWFSS